MESKVFVSAFGHVITRDVSGAVDASEKLLPQYSVELDKETGCTHVVKTGDIDMFELVQSYKDQCGIEYAMKLIKQGVDPNSFADDGKHGGDASLPTDINTLNEMNKDSEGKRLAQYLGITSDMSDEEIKQKILDALTPKAAQADDKEVIDNA